MTWEKDKIVEPDLNKSFLYNKSCFTLQNTGSKYNYIVIKNMVYHT